jgi:hypothetical protein
MQQELWNKISKLLDTCTVEDRLMDPATMIHSLHMNIPSYDEIEKNVKTFLRLQQRLVNENEAAYGFRTPAPPRLRNMDAEQGDMQPNSMQDLAICACKIFPQPREVALHAMQDAGSNDFLFHMVTGDMASPRDVYALTAIPCCSIEEAVDVAHVAHFNGQLNSLATSKCREERS